MSSAMFRANFPTLVPPNFCTIQVRGTPWLWALDTTAEGSRCPFAVPVTLILQGVREQPGRAGIGGLQVEGSNGAKRHRVTFFCGLTISACNSAKRCAKIASGQDAARGKGSVRLAGGLSA